MLKQYETLVLLDPNVSDEDFAALEKQFGTILKTSGKGTLAKFDKWGRYRLAYPIRKQSYGVYALARYELDDTDTFFPKIESHLRFKCTDFVMRHVHVRLEDGQMNAEYVRPQSIEEVGEPTDNRRQGGRGPRTPRTAPTETKQAATESTEQAAPAEAKEAEATPAADDTTAQG